MSNLLSVPKNRINDNREPLTGKPSAFQNTEEFLIDIVKSSNSLYNGKHNKSQVLGIITPLSIRKNSDETSTQ